MESLKFTRNKLIKNVSTFETSKVEIKKEYKMKRGNLKIDIDLEQYDRVLSKELKPSHQTFNLYKIEYEIFKMILEELRYDNFTFNKYITHIKKIQNCSGELSIIEDEEAEATAEPEPKGKNK